MNGPLFVPNVFSKALAWALIIVVTGLIGVILVNGTISALDVWGTLVDTVIVAYIAHLWVYYS